MELDGHKQRNALTAAEQALRALAAGDAARARANAIKAAQLDQVGLFTTLPAAVAEAAGRLDATGAVGEHGWTLVRAAVPEGPLQALIDAETG